MPTRIFTKVSRHQLVSTFGCSIMITLPLFGDGPGPNVPVMRLFLLLACKTKFTSPRLALQEVLILALITPCVLVTFEMLTPLVVAPVEPSMVKIKSSGP